MKNLQKLVSVMMVAMLMVVSLTACGGEEKTQDAVTNDGDGNVEASAAGVVDEKITITMLNEWMGSHFFTEYFDKELALFKEDHPEIIVEVEEISEGGTAKMDDKLRIMISGGELPDIFYTNDRSLIEAAYHSGLLYDLSEFYDEDVEFQAELDAATMESWNGTMEGTYAVCSSQNFFGMFYNKAILKENGYEEFPATWEEFYAMCDKLLANGVTPMALCTETSFIPSVTMLSRLASYGEEGEKQANQFPATDFNTPEFINAITELQTMFQKYTYPDAIGCSADGAVEKFGNGETAICFIGTWQLSVMREALGDDLGMAPIPGNGVIAYPDYAWFSGAKTPEKAKAAYEFIRHFNNTADQQMRLEMVGAFPVSQQLELANVEIDPIMEQLLNMRGKVDYSATSPWILYNAPAIAILPQEYAALASGAYTPEEFASEMTQISRQ